MADPATQDTPDTFSNTVGDMSINDILKDSGAQDALIQHAMTSIADTNKKLDAITAARAANARAAGAESSIIAGQKASGELQAQQGNRKFAAEAGTDISNAVTERMTQSAADLNAEYDKTLAVVNRMEDRRAGATGLFGQLKAGIQNLPDKRLLQVQEEKIGIIKDRISSLNAATQSVAKTQTDIAPISSAATVQATTTFAARKANDAALEAQQQGALYDLQGVQDVVKMGAEQLSNKEKVYSIGALAAQRDLYRQSTLNEIAMRRERLKLLEESADAERDMVSDVQFGLGALGKGGMTTQLPANKIVELTKSKTDLGEVIRRAEMIGMRHKIDPSQGVIIADNPGDAALTISVSRAPLTPALAPVKDILSQSLTAAREGRVASPDVALVPDKGNPQIAGEINKKENEEALSAATTLNVRARARQYSASINKNDFSNPYQAPDLASLGTIQGIKNDPFYSKVLVPLVSAGVKTTDPNQIVNLAKQAVIDKTVTFQQAALSIHRMFSASVQLNNAVKNYKTVGFPEQETYKTPVDYAGVTRNVDLSNYTQVSNILTEKLLSDSIPGGN